MKIAVIGAGGIGGFMGGALAKSGQDVSVIGRGKHLEAIRDRGLIVDSISLGKFQTKVKATDQPSDVGVVDLVLFCVKSYDTETALRGIGPLVGDDTMVLSFQNGVDNEDKIADAIGSTHVLAGAIAVESFIAEPGLIKQTSGPMRFVMGEMTGEITDRAKKINTAFTDAGLKCELSNRIQEILWEKFLFICAAGGVCSVTRSTIGDVIEYEQTRELYGSVMKEVETVARAKGIKLASDIVPRTLALTVSKSMKPSMLRDLELGKRLEIDALNGSVSKFGRQVSVPTPVDDFIYATLKIHDLKAKGSSIPI
ncbi:MAG TPA: 2-dehydropantoate 2-reductase [Candidatus Bathyarchaeia archaeon]|nr:2-dehydropantoate 2-reductase [Candidatus Bathyarchaeia archaeon]